MMIDWADFNVKIIIAYSGILVVLLLTYVVFFKRPDKKARN
jgi:hypothetical protein